MNFFLYSLISSVVIAILSSVGIVFLFLNDKSLKKILILLVSFSAGALLGGAFFHLLPEAVEEFGGGKVIFSYLIIGFSLFFVLERVLRWHHCHEVGCMTHKHLGHLNLIGDGVHNVIDGIIIISSFSLDFNLGVAITLSIALHEIPQEIGDLGVLLYSGFGRIKALIYNLVSASTVILGVIIGYFLLNRIDDFSCFLLPFAAGGFIYIASSDLIPELHKEINVKKAFLSFIIFSLAIVFMFLIAH